MNEVNLYITIEVDRRHRTTFSVCIMEVTVI